MKIRYMKLLALWLCASAWMGCSSPPPEKMRAWMGGEYITARDSLFKSLDDWPHPATMPWLPPAVLEKQKKAVFVSRVFEQTPAARAGLQAGDLIVSANGVQMESGEMLGAYVAARPPGSELALTIYRDGQFKEIQLVLGTERYKRVRSISLGLAFSPTLDLVPNPDFNVLSLLRYSRYRAPANLHAPEARYLAALATAAGQPEGVLELPGGGWDAWLLVLGFGSRDQVISQQ